MTLVQVPLTRSATRRRCCSGAGWSSLRCRVAALGALFFALMVGVAMVVWVAASIWPDLGMGRPTTARPGRSPVLLAGGAAEAARASDDPGQRQRSAWIAVRADARAGPCSSSAGCCRCRAVCCGRDGWLLGRGALRSFVIHARTAAVSLAGVQ
jgi:hypothetical protein